jgi:hypothetical protein
MSEIPPSNPWQEPPGYSNYPRASYGGGSGDPNGRPPGVYFDNIGKAWNLFQAEMGNWVLTMLVGGVIVTMIGASSSLGINYLVYGTILPNSSFADPRYYLTFVLGLIPGAINGIFSGSVMYMAVKQARGEPIGVQDLFSGFSCALPLMAVSIIQGLAIDAGIVCFLVPGIFLIGALAFSQILVIDQRLTAIDAIKLSFATLKRDAWMMFLLLFVSVLIVTLGFCMCLIGLLFTVPIYLLIVGLTYNTYFPGGRTYFGVNQPIGVEPPR